MKQKILLATFCLLYIAVAFVSLYHAIAFFALANPLWLATILAIAFEVGQAVVLFSILTNPGGSGSKQNLSWFLMILLTAVQVIGNVFSSYKYMLMYNTDQIKYFTGSVLFFVKSPDPEYNYVIISYIIGAILPIVALCMTSIIADNLNRGEKRLSHENSDNQQHKKIVG